MATLMVLLFMIHPLKALKGDLNNRLSGYSYGGASVLSPEFTRFFEPIMKNIVLGYDIVPRLSYGSIKDICNIMTAFDEMNTKEPEKLNDMLSLDTNINRMQMEPSSYNKSFMKLYENLKQKYMNSPKLFPMGRSFQIHDFKTQAIRRRTSYYDFVFTEVDALNCYEEIIFSKQFIKHHFPYFYEEGLWSNRVLYQNFLPVGDEKMIPIIESSNKQEI